MPRGPAWYVITTAPGAHGVPGHVTVSQKPFPIGAKEIQGPFATKAEALKAANAIFPGGTTGSGVAHQAGDDLAGIAAIGHFFANLTDRQTVVRIAEVTLGMALIVVGLAKLMENTEAGKALRSAIPAVAKIVPK